MVESFAPPDPMPDGEPAVRALLAWGLDGSALTLPRRPLSMWPWVAFVGRTEEQRVAGLLAAAIAEGEWPATDTQTEEVVAREERDAMQMLVLDRHLLKLADALDEHGVDWRLLKGPAHARQLWRRPELRRYSDIDLLARSEHFDAVCQLLEEGFDGHRALPDPLPGLTARVGKSVAFTLPDGVEIDLHRTLAGGPFGASLVTDDLFDQPGEIRIGGRPIPTLSRPAMFIHACLHATLALDERRLVPLRDVAEGLHNLRDASSAAEVVVLARRWRCRAPVARAVTRATEVFALPTDNRMARWAAGYRPAWWERAWLTTEVGPLPIDLVETITTGTAFPHPADLALYWRGVLLHPDRKPLRDRLQRALHGL